MTLNDLMGAKLGSDKPTDKSAPKPQKPKLHMTIHPLDDNRFHVQHDYRGQEPTPDRAEFAPAGMEELHKHIDKFYAPAKEAPASKE